MSSRPGIFIVAAKRTAYGTLGGKLKNHTATDLATIAAKAALQSSGISPENVDHVVFGNIVQTSKCAAYLARHAGLRAGLPNTVPAVTINRLCGSGFQSIVDGAYQIIAGDSNVVLTGGAESMSQAPFVVRDIRFGVPFGKTFEFEDILWTTAHDPHIKTLMAITAETLGDMYKLTRKDVDEYALRSQQRWKEANKDGRFKNEIAPIILKTKNGEESFEMDEHPRDTTYETLAQLPAVFKENGLITAGNASGVADGAASVIIASESAVKSLNLKPMVRLVAWHTVGVDPNIMGIGPVGAIKGVCKKAGIPLEKIDLIEINEAFAPQVLSNQKELKIEDERFNVNGGAISLGHPLASSGARISGHLAYEMKRRGAKYGIGSACCGGGQGIALLFELV